MSPVAIPSGCACCGLSRRRFLATSCAACAAGVLAVPQARAAESTRKGLRLRIVYALHAEKQPKPDWPNIGFDFVPVMEKISGALRSQCPDWEFLVSQADGPEQAKKILEGDQAGSIDGYIVCQLNCWNQVVQTFAPSGKPVLYVDFPYGGSGGFLVYTSGFLRNQAANLGFVASSQIDDLVAAVRCFELVQRGGSAADFAAATARIRKSRTPAPGDLTGIADPLTTLSTQECLRKLKETKLLAISGQDAKTDVWEGLGVQVVSVPFAELNDAWKAADQDQARGIAARWQKAADSVSDVTSETLEQSAAMYLAEKALLAKHGAQGITINCLGGFYGGHIHAYPCLGFHELNNEGLVGGCECDVRSSITMLAMNALTQGRPGYISDPVLDTSRRQIIYAHCVASNKVFGPQGPANPFQILTHSEDRQGAAVRSLMPVGYLTTTLLFDKNKKQILFHRAKAVENLLEDRACRTKVAAEPVGDLEKLFTQWCDWGWHRVTVYGDLKEPVFALADALGWKVVEEA